MARRPKPWFRKSRGVWYVCISGKQHNLGADRETAFRRFHELLSKPIPVNVPTNSVIAIIDAFLEWTKNHRAPRTYDWYLERTQSFVNFIPSSLTISQLKPFHIQQWVDSHDTWSDGMKRGAMSAVQRSMNWASKVGYIDGSPIRSIEKPSAGRRDGLIAPTEFKEILDLVNDDQFTDLLTVSWECVDACEDVSASIS